MSLFWPPRIANLEAKKDLSGLVKALGYQKESSVRVAAADALGRIGDSRAIEPLIAALNDEEWHVREAATRALVAIGDPRGQEPFIAVLREQTGYGCYQAAGVLTDFGWEPDRGDTGAAYWAAEKEWAKCVDIGAAAVPILIATFGQAVYLSDQTAVVESMGRIGDPSAVEFLISLLKTPGGGVNGAVAEALGRIGDPRAVEPLVVALDDADWHLRQAAAKALRKLGWKPGRDGTGAAYWAARGEWEKCVEIGAPAVAALLNGPVRQRQDSEALVAATKAIVQIGEAAVGPLLEALMDEDSRVRQTAADALDRLAWRPDRGTAAAAYWAARGEWTKCAALGPPAIEYLVRALKDGRKAVRTAAAEGLVAIYKSGNLGQADKAILLGQREVITTPHHDHERTIDDYDQYGDDWHGHVDLGHTDEGIGVAFPV